MSREKKKKRTHGTAVLWVGCAVCSAVVIMAFVLPALVMSWDASPSCIATRGSHLGRVLIQMISELPGLAAYSRGPRDATHVPGDIVLLEDAETGVPYYRCICTYIHPMRRSPSPPWSTIVSLLPFLHSSNHLFGPLARPARPAPSCPSRPCQTANLPRLRLLFSSACPSTQPHLIPPCLPVPDPHSLRVLHVRVPVLFCACPVPSCDTGRHSSISCQPPLLLPPSSYFFLLLLFPPPDPNFSSKRDNTILSATSSLFQRPPSTPPSTRRDGFKANR